MTMYVSRIGTASKCFCDSFSVTNVKSDQERKDTVNILLPAANDKHKQPSTPHTPHTPLSNHGSNEISANKSYSMDETQPNDIGPSKGPFMLAPTPAQLGRAPLQRRQSMGTIFINLCSNSNAFTLIT